MTRPTSPTRARRLGNPGKRALTVIEGQGWDLPELPEPPTGLGEAGRAAWEVLRGCGWVTLTDSPTVLIFCQRLDDRDRLRRDLLAEPYVAGSTGQKRPHPAAGMLAETEKLLERLARSLLLTPDDRIRVGVATSRARTALDELHAQDRAGGNRPDRRMEG